MTWLETILMGGFWFFLIKGLLWIVLFALVYFGAIKKENVNRFRELLRFRKSKSN